MSKSLSCLADRIDRNTAPLATIERWHLHRGTHKFYICGPGADAMHPCSVPVYTGRHPTITLREAIIARRAITILSARHSGRDAGREEIRAALDEADKLTPASITPASDPDDIDLSDILESNS